MLKHVAFIMDGNRRWARGRGLPAILGHREGVKTVERVTQYCLNQAIEYLTFYAFSLENFKRSDEEKNCLFELISDGVRSYAQKFMEQGIQINFIGDREKFPQQVRKSCEETEQLTAQNNRMRVNILFCYGGQQEIIAAVQSCAQQVQLGTLSLDGITPTYFAQLLWSGKFPAPDLIIRTGGMPRLSNFLLFQAAYSELLFTDTFWPALTDEELERLVEQYHAIKRNFGS
jgi:undecaprenyl diphosphate synthase